jgi:hypothetical protein
MAMAMAMEGVTEKMEREKSSLRWFYTAVRLATLRFPHLQKPAQR